MQIIEISRTDFHPNRIPGIGHTIRIYFQSGLRITAFKERPKYVQAENLPEIALTWNTCAKSLPNEIETLVRPIIEQHREWLLRK